MSNQEKSRAELQLRRAELQTELREIERRLRLHVSKGNGKIPPNAEPTLIDMISRYSSDLLSIHNIQGDYIYASPSCLRFLDLPPEKVVGRSAYEFFHHGDVEIIAAAHAKQLEDTEEGQTVRYRLQPARGSAIWVESHARPTPDGEFLVAVTKTIDDATRVPSETVIDEITREPMLDETLRLPNRQAIEAAIRRELDRAQRLGHPVSVALFDIDHFSRIDALRRQEEADRVLRNVTYLLQRNQRIYDTLGRWGRDEFALLLPETTIEQAWVAAERYRQTVDAARIISRGETVTLSAGLTSSNGGGISELFERLDAALFEAKESGRNRVASLH